MGRNGDGQQVAIYPAVMDGLVQYNDVAYVGYTGIYFVGSGVQVRNNHVHHYCMVKADGGAIYAYGGEERKAHAKPRVIDRNVVHDGVANIEAVHRQEAGNPYAAQCQGIYIASKATNVVVTGDSSFRNATTGLWLGSNGRVAALGNALADNQTTQLAVDDRKSPPDGSTCTTTCVSRSSASSCAGRRT